MLGLLLIGSAAATALLVASALRLPSLVSTLLAAYLAFVANLGMTTLALSPFREVTRGGLATAEIVLLLAALGAWWLRGRPGLPLTAARAATRQVMVDPVVALFLAVVVLLLGYELVLGLAVPPNNFDSLAYHLAKAAAWAQHGGIHWIPDAPTIRLTAFQPFAEQELLFLFVATGSGTLLALPQFLAQIAILVAVYGCSRRLGFDVRAAACGSFLFATFSVVALEATTAQNDLVAASFPAVAAYYLLGRGHGRLEPGLAGLSAGLGLGVKLTTGLVVPVLVALALIRGRRALVAGVAGGALGFVLIGMWGYVLNAIHTGHPLGGEAAKAIQYRSSPSYPGSVANAFYLLYGMMDLSVLSDRLIYALAATGAVVAIGVAAWSLRRGRARQAVGDAAAVATPFLAPLLVVGGAALVAFVADRWGFPIRGPDGLLGPLNEILNLEYTRFAHENYSAFGPLGIVSLLAATALAIWAYATRRADARHLVLAIALPLFLVLVAIQVRWNPFLLRFFLVPAVLTAPLLARLFRNRATTAAYLVVAALTIGLTMTEAITKPLQSRSGFGPPWNMTQVEALITNSRPELVDALPAFERLVPADACIGAILGDSEPSYLLFGPGFERRVVYVSPEDPLRRATEKGLFHVLIGDVGGASEAAAQFEAAGWRVQALGGAWYLASDPNANGWDCRS